MQKSVVKDPSLAAEGEKRIEWARRHMPVLEKIKEEFEREKPLKGARIVACLHVTVETANLITTLVAGGAEVAVTGSNPLSTQDEVAAALAARGLHVYAFRGENEKEYYDCIKKALDLQAQRQFGRRRRYHRHHPQGAAGAGRADVRRLRGDHHRCRAPAGHGRGQRSALSGQSPSTTPRPR